MKIFFYRFGPQFLPDNISINKITPIFKNRFKSSPAYVLRPLEVYSQIIHALTFIGSVLVITTTCFFDIPEILTVNQKKCWPDIVMVYLKAWCIFAFVSPCMEIIVHFLQWNWKPHSLRFFCYLTFDIRTIGHEMVVISVTLVCWKISEISLVSHCYIPYF